MGFVDTKKWLHSGIYTIPEASSLLNSSESSIRYWVNGSEKQNPLIENVIGWVDGRLAIGFVNLVEMRFVQFFRNAGVKAKTIRKAIEALREDQATSHPFFTETVFRTDGKSILAEIVKSESRKDLLDLSSNNYELREVTFPALREDVEFSSEGYVNAWYPRKQKFPNIIIDPNFSFGQPALKNKHVTTRTIFEASRAGESQQGIADLYEISVRDVRSALQFEKLVYCN